jgi:hypothetical protein
MQVQAVHHPLRHDVHPAIGHRQRPPLQIEGQRPREAPHVPLQSTLELGEGRR